MVGHSEGELAAGSSGEVVVPVAEKDGQICKSKRYLLLIGNSLDGSDKQEAGAISGNVNVHFGKKDGQQS